MSVYRPRERVQLVLSVVCIKRRPVVNRFKNFNTEVALTYANDVFSIPEQKIILEFARALGVDIAVLDVLRDKQTGALYIVDVNPTSTGPALLFTPTERAEAIHRVARAVAKEWFPEIVLNPPHVTERV